MKNYRNGEPIQGGNASCNLIMSWFENGSLKMRSWVTDDYFIGQIRYYSDNITEIDLDYCLTITDRAILEIPKHCPDLTKINLHKCQHVTDDAVIHLVEGCRNLLDIGLWDCRDLTDLALHHIAKNCDGLTTIDIDNCIHFTNEAIRMLRERHPSCKVWGESN